ncbi:MAG TPA: aminotransferase class V-fold PLP-dependent enzyme [Ktedonobacterales bacterium]|jgi:cystathionine gamma-synthase|nr:aminotransferase class V-fold PLP-dependent enzyme [Ktedonobacterales bacterium]
MRFETLAIHADHESDPATGAVTPPLHLSTTFERAADGSYPHGYIYARTENPTRDALERLLAALEGGAVESANATAATYEAAMFASGLAATAAVFQSLAPGDHVLAPSDVYHGAAKQLRTIFAPWGLAVDFVDMSDLDAVQAALRPTTQLVWVETPSNPMLKISDIEAISALAHAVGAAVACDNTWATPVAQQPFALGADLVVHSTTKYLGGHSDTLGGAVIGRAGDEQFARIRQIQGSVGAVLSPFDSWLTMRGIRTLAYRMRGHTEHALAVARMLAEHPAVAAVHYPGLPTHAGYAVATRQMSLAGGMLSIQTRGGAETAMAVAAATRIFTRATSLGGVESLIEHRASVEGPTSKTPQNLLRLSIGLEHPDDLIEDLAQALHAASGR